MVTRQGASKAQAKKLKNSFKQISKKTVETQNANLVLEINDLRTKLMLTHTKMLQMITRFGDFETRVEALKTMGIEKGLFTETEFDSVWDRTKGLRIKAPDETIAPEDLIYVGFRAVDKQTGEVVLEDDSFSPVRVGAGQLIIEDHLIGKPVGSGSVQFEHTYEEKYEPFPELSGKTVSFDVAIGKVKSRITPTQSTHSSPGGTETHV